MIGSVLSQVTAEQAQVVYEFARLKSLEGWWVWAAVLTGVVIGVTFLTRFYQRDAADLRPAIRRTLIGLRLVVLLAVIFLFGDLQRRTERTLMLPSEVAVVIDTSQSMTLASGTSSSSSTREEKAIELLEDTSLLDGLAEDHRLSIYSLGEQSEAELLEASGLGTDSDSTIQSSTKPSNGALSSSPSENSEGSSGESRDLAGGGSVDPEMEETSSEVELDSPILAASNLAISGASMLATGLLFALLSLALGAFRREQLLGRILPLVPPLIGIGIVLLGSTYTVHTGRSLRSLLFGTQSRTTIPSPSSVASGRDGSAADNDSSESVANKLDTDWKQELAATATQSRIGDAIATVLNSHDPATLAGVVLITDGQNNGGSDVNAALASARRNEIALYPIGMGSGDAPQNVGVIDIDAPKRVYPGDKFTITATLQASGPRVTQVDVELLDSLAPSVVGGDAPDNSSMDVIQRLSVELPVDGSLIPVRFEMEPETVGRRTLAIRLIPRGEDQNPRDNYSDAKYEVVAKKLRVLAIAGGPTREYRFVRNLYYRDRSIDLDVWLQTGQLGMSQDADRLLNAFPDTAEELFEYDVVAMFDPDWTAMTLAQLELLERWVSQQAGGLIMVAGPVFHPKWIQLRTDPRVAKIAGLFPVTFSTRGAVISSGRQGGEAAWPLGMTQEARRAEFLWIGGDAAASENVWRDFSGVYDFVDTKDAKPGSKVYAYFSDPTTQTGGTLPVYLASQFYGAGRTFFQASGEMWRIRGDGDRYFQSYFTKLARWVSEGRLLRDSTRGVLLLDSPNAMLGDSIAVRAVLSDEQFQPLDVPSVDANVFTPSGRIEVLRLRTLQGEPRAGTYGGQFVVRESGDHEVRLTLGDALNEQLLRQSVRVRLPTMELERPRRNDELLNRIAQITDGLYLPVDDSASVTSVADQLIATIQPRPQQSILPGTYDAAFVLRRNAVLMWLLTTFLTMEWLVRRLHRLA